ncbi:MAG: hypothetical protein ACM3UU_10155 [Ignavibacteriales bacterium]
MSKGSVYSDYDRDVTSTKSSSGWGGSNYGASTDSQKALSATDLDSSMDPKGKKLKSNSKHPIIIFLDVTGSNIEFAGIMYDKLPMMYEQIGAQGYLDD